MHRTGSFDIWQVNSDGSSITQVVSTIETAGKPIISPDGLKLAFAKPDGLYVKALSDGEEIKLTTGAGDSNPSWSKDGTEIAYNDNTGNIYARKFY